MQIFQPDYYDSFSCIAGDCPDTCCVGWQVILDSEHESYYRSLPGELGDDLRKNLRLCEGETALAMKDGRCCMLRPDGLCRIQYELGHDALSQVCGFYPRFVTELGLTREQGLSISCPEVARMVLSREEPFRIQSYTTEEPLRYFHDIEPEYLLEVRKGRAEGLEAVQDRSRPLGQRLIELLRIGLQSEGECLPCKARPASLTEYLSFRKVLLDTYLSLEQLREDWTALLQDCYNHTPLTQLDNRIPWEQLLCYYLFKYSLRSAMDGDFSEKLRLIVLHTLLLQELHSHSPDLRFLVQLHAKETDHNEENLASLQQALREKNVSLPRDFKQSFLQSYK